MISFEWKELSQYHKQCIDLYDTNYKPSVHRSSGLCLSNDCKIASIYQILAYLRLDSTEHLW